MHCAARCVTWMAAVSLFAAMIVATENAPAAPRLVVMAVDSGSDTSAPYSLQPPELTPGAKGFLIGLDMGELAEPTAIGFQDLMIHGDGLINLAGMGQAEGNSADSPNIATRSGVLLRGLEDGVKYARETTYVVDQPYTTSLGETTWTLIRPGMDSGDGYIRMAGALIGLTPQGVYPLAYVVSTSDLTVSGLVALGTDGFDVAGNPLAGGYAATPASILDFATGAIVPDPLGTLVPGPQPAPKPVSPPIVPPVIDPPVVDPPVVEPPILEPAVVIPPAIEPPPIVPPAVEPPVDPPCGAITLPPELTGEIPPPVEITPLPVNLTPVELPPPPDSPGDDPLSGEITPLPDSPAPVEIPPLAELPAEESPIAAPTGDQPVIPGDVPTNWDPSLLPVEAPLILPAEWTIDNGDVTTLPENLILKDLKFLASTDGPSDGTLAVTTGLYRPVVYGADMALAYGRAIPQNMPGGEYPAAPEPSSLVLAGAALLGLTILGRRRRSRV